MPRIDINIIYLKNAYEFAKLSYAKRRKVGSVIVKDSQIISFGYNGMPAGFNNICEYPISPPIVNNSNSDNLDNFKTKQEVLHAESNAITKVARSTMSCENASLYTTTCPCYECSKLIIQSGISSVYYCENYNKQDGLKLLEEAGIYIYQYPIESLKIE